ncbi:hypothetical protein TNCV_5076141 [Trichonephila clavipes]|uniref:Uncharacterized protein n=1 Tax=Trichonephila clavipes TaxID=2585209 RepID=A0A8X6V1K5_TRICX|nr:hypothetical protein TNCV_5076141 [Trichonephila clavipes]
MTLDQHNTQLWALENLYNTGLCAVHSCFFINIWPPLSETTSFSLVYEHVFNYAHFHTVCSQSFCSALIRPQDMKNAKSEEKVE